MKKSIILIGCLLCLLQASAQDCNRKVDSLGRKLDTVERKLVAARVCIFNVQDYLYKGRGKNSVYLWGWIQNRALGAWYFGEKMAIPAPINGKKKPKVKPRAKQRK